MARAIRLLLFAMSSKFISNGEEEVLEPTAGRELDEGWISKNNIFNLFSLLTFNSFVDFLLPHHTIRLIRLLFCIGLGRRTVPEMDMHIVVWRVPLEVVGCL